MKFVRPETLETLNPGRRDFAGNGRQRQGPLSPNFFRELNGIRGRIHDMKGTRFQRKTTQHGEIFVKANSEKSPDTRIAPRPLKE